MYSATHFLRFLPKMMRDVKTVQSLMRHANSNITMNIYTHAVSSKKRRAQSKVVEMILTQEKTAPVAAGVA
jgi:integrase